MLPRLDGGLGAEFWVAVLSEITGATQQFLVNLRFELR